MNHLQAEVDELRRLVKKYEARCMQLELELIKLKHGLRTGSKQEGKDHGLPKAHSDHSAL